MKETFHLFNNIHAFLFKFETNKPKKGDKSWERNLETVAVVGPSWETLLKEFCLHIN